MPLQPSTLLRQQPIWEMAIEQDLGFGVEQSEKGYACAELVNDDDVRVDLAKLGREDSGTDYQSKLAQYREEDAESTADGGREDGIAANSYIERSLGEVSASSNLAIAIAKCQW